MWSFRNLGSFQVDEVTVYWLSFFFFFNFFAFKLHIHFQYMLSGSEKNSFKHISFIVCKMLSILSRGCWRDVAGSRGFFYCFRWLRLRGAHCVGQQ